MTGNQWRRQPDKHQRPNHPQPRFPNPNFASHTAHAYRYDPGFPHHPWHQSPGAYGGYQPPFPGFFRPDMGTVDAAARKAWSDLWAGGESVSAWRVSQATLVALNVESWGSLGFQMQQVPTLNSLALVEGKINAFIHCFVAVQSITTLHDLEDEICKEEGVAGFQDLGLGPLHRHPLVLCYFSLPSDFTEIFNIATTQTVQLLGKFLNTNQHEEIRVEEFFAFVANARNVAEKSKLGILIRDFGALVKIMRKASDFEDSVFGELEETVKPDIEAHAEFGKHKEMVKTNIKSHERLQKHEETVKPNIKKRSKRPLFTMLKKELDQRFDSISQRVESFPPIKKGFCGKHTRFVSSSSSEEAEPRNDYSSENDSDDSEEVFSPKSGVNSELVSSCPYPSVNEEMTRLGLKAETMAKPFSASDKQKQCKSSRSGKRKKQSRENLTNSLTRPSKLRKINSSGLRVASEMTPSRSHRNEFQLSDYSLKLFVGIWKERCQGVNLLGALKKMLRFYKVRDKRETWNMYTSYPFLGILHVAFSSITLGLWDSIYDTVQDVGRSNVWKPLISDACEYENINVEPTSKDAPVLAGPIFHCTNVEDIIKKLAEYLKHNHKDSRNDIKVGFSMLRKLSNCENWLVDQYCVKEFRALGNGDFLPFMEKHASLLPHELCGFLSCNASQESPLEVCMMHRQLVTLLSQASHNIWANRKISEQDVLSLLTKQFPLITFKVVTNGSLEDFLSAAVKDGNSSSPKSVIYSLTLCKTPDTLESVSSKSLLENSSVKFDCDPDIQTREIVTSKDAINVLLKAPMLSDLNLWSHWDIRFAPSLGPLVPWLLKEEKTDEILCLVTRNGKVVRIDPSASADLFLEAAIQGSSFETAVQILSLFSIVGGQEHVSASLLKCHAQHAFKVISENSLEDGESNNRDNSLFNKEVSQKNSAVARFILDCLLYMPSETRAFGADVFLHAMQAVVKNAASAILCECSHIDQRLMLHELGFSVGVVEWIDDFHEFCLKGQHNLGICEEVTRNAKDSTHRQDVSKNLSASKGSTNVLVSEDVRTDSSLGEVMSNVEGSDSRISREEDADLIVESIRRDEFGLIPSLSSVESGLLKKQHARLGRALHCLSQELYSQDSHFILELVQNADDNNYPENVEPTLTFILQESGIIVLNNERGFTAQNIRALCDIGSSTKKGSNSGYIGQKGIGFKSVFRITDAPEIHSNGFHVKFDISEGQIGFVLPTVVPPCDLKLFSRLASSDLDQIGFNNWNTCIVLPFKSKSSEGNAIRSIMSMFSDLHPSLLLFLHRLECIKFRNLLEDSVVVMRKEIVGDGIVNVSYGKEKMTWFVVSQKIQSKFIRPDVDWTEISLAFTLQESSDGVYNPVLSQQPVFAFLPLRTYGLKFILQGNFALPSSREEVDGSSPWNQWLLSEFPGLFVQAEKSFCDLPCFKNFPGKAVSAFMSFVPLLGEVHGFFSSLPRMIISKLRSSKCLLLEGEIREFVPPCKVLRGWSEEARSILPHRLLHEHLGLGFLDKNVALSDSLARALGIEEYGPKVLVQFIASLSRQESGLKSMGLRWLSSSLMELYSMMEHFPGRTVLDSEMETDILNTLKRIPFIPLSNGSLSSVDEGTIWIQSGSSSIGSDNEHRIESFPCIYAKLRIVNPVLLSADGSSSSALTVFDKLSSMLHKIGVQRLSAHEIIRVHILPAISDENSLKDRNLMIEYICFVMSHLNSSCHDCHIEREFIMSELHSKAYILTTKGFKRPADDYVHFSTDFGNLVDTTKLFGSVDIRWHEVDSAYLKHPITESLPSGLKKWREFFQEIGFTDFVKVIQVEKTLASISHTQLKNPVPDSFSLGSMVKDWESPELVKLVSLFSRDSNIKSCEYLLEILDKLWDSCFSDKTAAFWSSESIVGCKPFKSSFISTLSDTQWVVSSMDDKLHYPRDLYYDCDAVRSVLGSSAPYAVPKVKNEKLVSEIGLKTKVTLEDVAMLQIWSCKTPFMASTAQMSKLYMFVWTELCDSKKLKDEFCSGCSIFVPFTSGSRHDDIVSGTFLSPHEVYWSDSTGAMDLMNPENGLETETLNPLNKTLCNTYPSLHDFFVKSCGVLENPSLFSYVQILLQLSTVALPSQAAKAVFQILLKWADGLKPGSEEVAHIKESLTKVEYAVLPTKLDKWVSLHPSFGVTCWCDEKKLRKHFKHADGIDFIYFGKLNKGEKEMLRTKVSVLMRNLGIPALSEVISREAVYYGLSDSTFKASLVNWVLPYAQRYLHALHPDTYSDLKKSGFDTIISLKIVVVEELFYKNVIKCCGSKSDKRVKCTTLLQDKILYVTRESDTHALFSELSRLFFKGNPELHMANFLHMITTMVESGSNEDQTEFFILNSQKVPVLPDEESVWSLLPVSWSAENLPSETIKKKGSSKSNAKAPEASNWPPVDWKTAPGFGYALEQGFQSQYTQHIHGLEDVDRTCGASQISHEGNNTIEDYLGTTFIETPEKKYSNATDEPDPETWSHEPKLSREINPNPNRLALSQHYKSNLIKIGQPNERGIITGRLGEQFAFKYFAELAGYSAVAWVNKDTETGLPYDLEIGCGDGLKEYVEVKATVSANKNWVMISPREWAFANEKRDAFSIAHVVLINDNAARIAVLKNPARLLEKRAIQLLVVMPPEQTYVSVSA